MVSAAASDANTDLLSKEYLVTSAESGPLATSDDRQKSDDDASQDDQLANAIGCREDQGIAAPTLNYPGNGLSGGSLRPRATSMARFQKGRSGNPGGRPKIIGEVSRDTGLTLDAELALEPAVASHEPDEASERWILRCAKDAAADLPRPRGF